MGRRTVPRPARLPDRQPAKASLTFDELCVGIIREESKQVLLRIVQQLQNNGAQGVILGCTELGLIIHSEDLELPVFDTALIHAREAALAALR